MFQRGLFFGYRLHLVARGYAQQCRRLWSRSAGWRELLLFETRVGVKYKNSDFRSDYFGRYSPQTVDFSAAHLSWDDLLLPPDLLKNPFTNCGKTVLASPHFELMVALQRGAAPLAYMKRVRAGTLDGRLPGYADAAFLKRQYQKRLAALARNGRVSVWVTPIVWRGQPKYMIVDGKHRAALVAQLNRPEALRLQVITHGFAQDPFFQTIYSFVQSLKPDDYSINQEMIQAVLYES